METEIPCDVYDDPDYDPQIDAIVQVVFQCGNRDKQSILALFLNCQDDYRIVNYEYAADDT